MRKSNCRRSGRPAGIRGWARVCASARTLAFIGTGAAVLAGVFAAAPSAAARPAVALFTGPSPAIPPDEDLFTAPPGEDRSATAPFAGPSPGLPPDQAEDPSAPVPSTAPSASASSTAPSATAPPNAPSAGIAPQANPTSHAMIQALTADNSTRITPVAPRSAPAAKPAAAARATALVQLGRPGSRVLGSSLAYATIPGHRRPKLVWLVSVDPAGGLTSVSSASQRANFVVEMIKARSLRWEMTSIGRTGQLPALPNIPAR